MAKIFLAEDMKAHLRGDIFSVLEEISKLAKTFNTNVYLVGGVVRDLLLGRDIYDVDVVVQGDTIVFCEFMEISSACKLVKKSPDFCTAKVRFKNGTEVDFASTRSESYPKKGQLPVVREIGCELEADVLRRDFSVNALAISLSCENFGQLIDYVGGLEDLQLKRLRVLHDGSFIDDPTRIIRGLRFVSKLGFELDEHTKELQEEYLAGFEQKDICYERIKQVIRLAFNLNDPILFDRFIEERVYRLISTCSCEVKTVSGAVVAEAISWAGEFVSPDKVWLIYFGCFMAFYGDYGVLDRLNLTNEEKEILLGLQELLDADFEPESDFDIYVFFKGIASEAIVGYYAITKYEEAFRYLREIRFVELNISGDDLIELGYRQGKVIGEILNKVLEQKVNGKISTRDDELRFAKMLMK